MSSSATQSAEHTNEDGLAYGDSYFAEEGQQPSAHQSLSHAVHARRSEYTRLHHTKIKVGTWNVAACSGVERDVGAWFVHGKGIDENLSALAIAAEVEASGSQKGLESVEEQEARRSKKHSTVPKNDEGLIPGGKEIGLYVLGLQEVVELASAKEYMSRIYSDPGPLGRWKKSMAEALPSGYELISEQQLSGLLMLIYAAPEIAPTVSSVSMQSVGTGVMGYMGNKGAVVTRIVLGETTRLVFVNSHLASGTDPTNLDRRCWDVAQILSRTLFDPISRGGVLDDHQERIGEEDFAFWFGDLNFRLEGLPGDDIRRLLMLHTKGEYGSGRSKSKSMIEKELAEDDSLIIIKRRDSDDESHPSTNDTIDSSKDSDGTDDTSLPDPDEFIQDPHNDPESLQATLDSLLPHDQLARVIKQNLAFHDGWREGPITFLPTYRYDVGSMGMFDSSEKKRTPSWCDRILFRTRKDKLSYDGKRQEEEIAKLKDEEMKQRGIDQASDEEDILFDYDPDADGVDKDDDKGYDGYDDDVSATVEITTKEGYLDRIRQDVYTSHQRVLSSDHKPVDAVFTIDYEAVVPELKSKIQQEVARELDRAENEGRPTITVVIDHSQDSDVSGLPGHGVQSPSTEGAEGVDFGNIAFLFRLRKGLTIANTGQCSAKLCFAKTPSADGGEGSIAPSWLNLRISGSEYGNTTQSSLRLDSEIILQPGDTINVALEAFVDDIGVVRELNQGSQKLDDVLVLRVTDGRDHFIPVRGSWLQSCFGGSIEELIRVPEGGVRALVPRRKGNCDGGLVNRSEEVRWSAPRELFKLTEATEWLVERTLADNGMVEDMNVPIEQLGWPFDPSTWSTRDTNLREDRRHQLLEALDADKGLIISFPHDVPAYQKLEIVAEVLLKFIESLSDGIITSNLWQQIEEDMKARDKNAALGAEEEKSRILDIMASAPNHNISLVFLTAMLGKIAGEIAPVSASSVQSKSSFSSNVRRSLSFKGKQPPVEDPKTLKRLAVNKKYAEIFAPAICRGATGKTKEKDRKGIEEKQRHIVEVFLNGLVEQQVA